MIYSLTCFFLRALFRLLFRYKAYGMDSIPEKGPFIIASNHVSHLDPIAVGAFVSRKLNYIAKKELFRNRYFGWYLRKLRCIAIDRDVATPGGIRGGIKEVIRGIREDVPIVIFPEGRRSDGITFLKPEAGVGYFAVRFNLPVLPVYVKGTEKALPKAARFIKFKPISVYYGEPKLYRVPSAVDRNRAFEDVSNKVMDEIRKLKQRHGN